MPGWTDDYAWNGFIRFEEASMLYANPPEGFRRHGQQLHMAGDSYPYLLTGEWLTDYSRAAHP